MIEKLPNNINIHINSEKENFLDGYIRFLDEDEIKVILEISSKSYIWNGGIPFATTAFGDVLVWNEGYVVLYDFTNNDYNIILSGTDFFFENINDEEYQKDFFDMELYKSSVDKFGYIDNDECFILEPIPMLGGARELKYVQIGKMTTYIALLVSASDTF